MKSSGDSGSPWRKPLPYWMGRSGELFNMTLEVEEDRSAVIQFCQRVGKPLCCMRDKR
jgi:hypothetical protein